MYRIKWPDNETLGSPLRDKYEDEAGVHEFLCLLVMNKARGTAQRSRHQKRRSAEFRTKVTTSQPPPQPTPPTRPRLTPPGETKKEEKALIARASKRCFLFHFNSVLLCPHIDIFLGPPFVRWLGAGASSQLCGPTRLGSNFARSPTRPCRLPDERKTRSRKKSLAHLPIEPPSDCTPR